MANSLLTFSGGNKLKSSSLSGCGISVVGLFAILFIICYALNSSQSSGKKKTKNKKQFEILLVKNNLKECLLSIFCFIIKGKCSSEKGLIVNCSERFILLHMVIKF